MNVMPRKTASKKVSVPSSDEAPVLHQRLTLIEVDDPDQLEVLRADRKIGPFIAATLSDRVAVVFPGKGTLVLKALLKAGHTPKVIEAS